MLQSQLFTKTQKEIPSDETSISAQYLIRAGFVDKLSAGVYTMLPLGFRVLQKIEKIIAASMDNLGAQRVLMPALIQKSNWETTHRWEILDVLFKIKGQGGQEYGLGATQEEVVTPLAKRFAFSYKDFPFAAYQIQTKFRDELRAKSGLLRGREFMMKDLYSFHLTQADCDQYYEKLKEVYFSIFKEVGLAQDTYLTLASGGTFSKFSHEFQAATSAGEDIIYLCDNCGFTINREIKEEYPACPECGCKEFNDKKSIEIGNIFKLGTKYTAAFEFLAQDQNGCYVPVLMNCYGIGLTRLMGTVAEVLHDEHGLIWPKSVAPFKIHLIELASKETKVKEAAQKLYSDLQSKGLEVLYDDRADKSAGEKFKDADLLGMPYRLVISDKALAQNSIELKKRDQKETELIGLNEILKYEF